MFITNRRFKKGDDVAYRGWSRRPYYILRGAKITKDQAFDMILNENVGLECYKNYNENEIKKRKRLEIDNYRYGTINTCISMLKSQSYIWIQTFVDPMGNVGTNYFTAKWPEEYNFIVEHLLYIKRYPYLSYVVIYTDFNEMDEKWDISIYKPFNMIRIDRIKERFTYALHVHDGGVEVVNKEEAFKLYEKYMQEYSCDEIFCRDDYNNYVKPYMDEKYIDKLCDKWEVSKALRDEIKSYNIINAEEEAKKFYKTQEKYTKKIAEKIGNMKLYQLSIEMMDDVQRAIKNGDYDLRSVNFRENERKCYEWLESVNNIV